jgi:hypothetical protein
VAKLLRDSWMSVSGSNINVAILLLGLYISTERANEKTVIAEALTPMDSVNRLMISSLSVVGGNCRNLKTARLIFIAVGLVQLR